MLLNYLYTNFFEERQFADVVKATTEELTALITAGVVPSPSYAYDSKGQPVSFVAEFSDEQSYRFHLRGHTNWYREITQLGLDTEARARAYLFTRYDEAKMTFLSSSLGTELQVQVPDVADQFDEDHARSNWDHFLKGVYGVCTRDGRPEKLSHPQIVLLRCAVDFLDGVESHFAPHEAPLVSRQRCIVDVKAQFFDMKAA